MWRSCHITTCVWQFQWRKRNRHHHTANILELHLVHCSYVSFWRHLYDTWAILSITIHISMVLSKSDATPVPNFKHFMLHVPVVQHLIAYPICYWQTTGLGHTEITWAGSSGKDFNFVILTCLFKMDTRQYSNELNWALIQYKDDILPV